MSTAITPTSPPVPKGTPLRVTRPSATHERLAMAIVVFVGVDSKGRWRCEHEGLLHSFWPSELEATHDIAAGDDVKVLPHSMGIAEVQKLYGKILPVVAVEGDRVEVLLGNGDTAHLNLYEVEKVEAIETVNVEVLSGDRDERRQQLEEQARKGLQNTVASLAVIRREGLWRDALDTNGKRFTNFKRYCSHVFGLCPAQAMRRARAGDILLDLIETTENDGTIKSLKVDPKQLSVNTLTELNRLPQDRHVEALEGLEVEGRSPTASEMRQRVDTMLGTERSPKPEPGASEPQTVHIETIGNDKTEPIVQDPVIPVADALTNELRSLVAAYGKDQIFRALEAI